MIICGIDPGKKGGLCFLSSNGGMGTFVMPPTPRDLAHAFIPYRAAPLHVFLEKAQSMGLRGAGDKRAGQSGQFSYGQGFGEIIGVLSALEIPFTLVRPQDWMKVMHARTDKTHPEVATKQRSMEAARQLWPHMTFIPPRCRVPHIGIIEAALIAEYGRRTWKH